MKEPIKPSEIRKGDTVRVEYAPGSINTAIEFVSDRENGHRATDYMPGCTFYLLDRPEPAVELPTEPTLGWIACGSGSRYLSRFRGSEPSEAYEFDASGDIVNTWFGITAFTPATAVPTSALDELRKIHLSREGCGELKCGSYRDIDKFLAAIDKAATS